MHADADMIAVRGVILCRFVASMLVGMEEWLAREEPDRESQYWPRRNDACSGPIERAEGTDVHDPRTRPTHLWPFLTHFDSFIQMPLHPFGVPPRPGLQRI